MSMIKMNNFFSLSLWIMLSLASFTAIAATGGSGGGSGSTPSTPEGGAEGSSVLLQVPEGHEDTEFALDISDFVATDANPIIGYKYDLSGMISGSALCNGLNFISSFPGTLAQLQQNMPSKEQLVGLGTGIAVIAIMTKLKSIDPGLFEEIKAALDEMKGSFSLSLGTCEDMVDASLDGGNPAEQMLKVKRSRALKKKIEKDGPSSDLVGALRNFNTALEDAGPGFIEDIITEAVNRIGGFLESPIKLCSGTPKKAEEDIKEMVGFMAIDEKTNETTSGPALGYGFKLTEFKDKITTEFDRLEAQFTGGTGVQSKDMPKISPFYRKMLPLSFFLEMMQIFQFEKEYYDYRKIQLATIIAKANVYDCIDVYKQILVAQKDDPKMSDIQRIDIDERLATFDMAKKELASGVKEGEDFYKSYIDQLKQDVEAKSKGRPR